MKISDFIFRFSIGEYCKNDGLCRVRIFIGRNNSIVTLITDINDLYPSASITNSIEYICSQLVDRGLVNSKAIFIEHYEKDGISCASFDIVEFDDNRRVSWKKINEDYLRDLIECDDNELDNLTKENEGLISQIDRIKYSINPEGDFLFRENHDVIKRRMEIYDESISKKALKSIIESGAKEQDVSRLIKGDLSILGEIYANPKEEYICLSEFLIEDGYVDYVILTGRSRMNVYLIEIKGADFNLVNKNSDKFNEKINEASQQIDRRLGYIFRNYQYFRQNIHDVRRRVENGEQIFNSFRGPIGKLNVDPNKDINIYSVIIGGRTDDDYRESMLRHNYEIRSSSKIKLESWDTFLRKLSRE